MAEIWGAVAAAAVGAGVSMYGANKQAKANQGAQAQNAALQEQQNAAAWANYLMTRGISPNGAKPGEIPANAAAINARLPLWANVRRTAGGSYRMPAPVGTGVGSNQPLGGRSWAGLGIQR